MRIAAALLLCLSFAQAQETAVIRKMADNKFGPLPVLPSCMTAAVQSGDPSKGAFVLAGKGTAGCVIPWHWHTGTEHVMIVSGSAKVEMKDGGKSAVLGPGGYAMLPAKHVHQFQCTTACSIFVSSAVAFDIHYVDAGGKEIPVDAALAKKKK